MAVAVKDKDIGWRAAKVIGIDATEHKVKIKFDEFPDDKHDVWRAVDDSDRLRSWVRPSTSYDSRSDRRTNRYIPTEPATSTPPTARVQQ